MPPKKYNILWSAFGGKLVSAGRDGVVCHGPTGMVVKAPRRLKDDTTATGYRDTDSVPYFEHERAMLALMQEKLLHPNIIQSVLSTSDGVFLPLMKESLQNVLDRDGRANDDDATRWLVQIASAAAWLESIDYFHGDLRPPNILLDAEGHVKICDFGNMARRGETNYGATIPYYKDQKVGPASEQHAIGSLMYVLFTGHELLHDVDDYQTKDRMLRDGQLPPVENIRAGHVIQDCWAGRYGTLEQLHSVLLVEMGLGLEYKNPAVCLTPEECATKAAECKAWGKMRRAWLEECRQRNAKRNT
ncbi:Protein kinase-like domain protein [Niveomyces insectorum RCEF 264]|uniref:Protein kinase-like domain protein n=1 Tax=Niveomyces insectorum RCEF 264 TaxID=1081102 RepID=A0A167W8F9_9HYPO|nr:Protein kinase-like domain protein [Niveomyces insectorum RCEF 264]